MGNGYNLEMVECETLQDRPISTSGAPRRAACAGHLDLMRRQRVPSIVHACADQFTLEFGKAPEHDEHQPPMR